MADPLSITLATISLATALKDIIELAQMIEESFVKAAQNVRDLHNLAAEISATVAELKGFCDEHYEILSDAKDMKVALLDLIIDMKTVYSKCCQMNPPAPEKKLGKFKLAFSGWKNRNKIEAEIRELRNRVNKCHSRFMMFAIMRIEKRLVVMGDRNVNNFTNTRKEITIKRRVSNENLIAFVGSNQRTLSKLPPEITADFISDIYLRLQIDAIDDYLNDLSGKNSYPVEAPLEDYLRPYQPVVHVGPTVDRNVFKQNIVAQTLEIQTYLRSDSSTLSIQTGAWSMVNLSIGLHSLEMYEEAASMGLWTVNLFRTLAKTNSAVYSPYLVHALRLLSRFYIKIDDNDKAQVAIKEAIAISRGLQSPFADAELKFQLGEALITLAHVSDLIGDCAESLKAAQEGVRAYEEVVIKSYIPNSETNHGYYLWRTYNKWDHALARFSDKGISDYARALDQLSFSFQGMDQLEDAVQADMKALDILLYSGLLFSDTIQLDIAGLLYRLSHQQFDQIVGLDQALAYAQRAADIYRDQCEKDRPRHVLSLCQTLYEQANILGKLERYDEALAVWKETSELAKDIIDDQVFRADALNQLSWSYRRLKRHDEAATIRTESVTVYQMALDSTSDKAAHGYYNLSVDLRLAGRFSEAIEALQIAITKYRALAFNDPDRYTKNIANTLNQLTLNLIHSNRHDEAFNDGYESLKLHAIMIDKDPTVLPEYKYALRLNHFVTEVAEKESKCMERTRYNLVCARNLAKRFPEECNLLLMQAILSQAIVFSRFDRLSDAHTAVQEALNWFDSNPSKDSKEAEQHMHCLITAASILHNQGYTKKALNLLQKSIEVAECQSSDQVIASMLVGSMHRRAQVLGLMGLYVEAAKASAECETFARQNSFTSVVDLIGCLRIRCATLRDIEEPENAIASIEEALELCRSEGLVEAARTRSAAYVLESECLYIISDCLADMGREAAALVYAQQSVGAALELKNKYPILPWLDIEPTYIDALQTFTMSLAANDNLPRALETIVEVRSYHEKYVQCRNGASLSLARALDTEGILYCAAGRHDEGISARTKLQNLQSRLEIALPDLAEQIRLQLAKEQTYPSSVALLAKLKIRCGHQQEASHA